MKRIVSVYLPHWPIERRTASALSQARRRGAGAALAGVPAERPFALVLPCERGLVLSACNRRALDEGLAEGETLADARARVPALLSAPAEPAEDRAALERLALWCTRYGPAVNLETPLSGTRPAAGKTSGRRHSPAAEPRGLWLDVTGVPHLFGSEERLLADLEVRLARLGLTARLGLASTYGAAHALARFAPVGRASALQIDTHLAALAALPVAGLRLDERTLLLLRRLGLTRIGELAALPRPALERRFPRATGEAVLLRLDQALGLAEEPLVALRPPPPVRAQRHFPDPLISHEGLVAALAALTDELCAACQASLTGVRSLVLSVYRADGTVLELGAGLSAPTRTPAHIQRLMAEKLEAVDAGLGVDALALAATRIEPLRPVQASLAGESADGALAALVDRLANRLGGQRVQRLVACASHIPERAEARRSALLDVAKRVGAHTHAGPPRPPLLLPEPEPIAVMAEVPEGPPAHFTWRRLPRRVVRFEGPERIAPEWWREIGKPAPALARTRDYYRIEDEAGRRYWVYRDGLYQDRGECREASPRWYLHGLFG
jgi:protein ImuB